MRPATARTRSWASTPLIGSRFADTITGDAGINFLSGGAGDDVLEGGGGFDFATYDFGVTASLATGTASGTQGADRLGGIEGLIGGGSTFAQFAGPDTFTGDATANYLSGGGGDDTLAGAAGDDRVHGDSGDDLVRGEAGDDVVSGESGADALDGGAGSFDSVSYLAAAAAVEVDLAAGRANGGAGADTVRGAEAVSGSVHDDTIRGDAAANALAGNSGNDAVAGGPSSDFLGGGSGSDTLTGGAGSDYCLGERRPGCEVTGEPGILPGRAARPPVDTAGLRPRAAGDLGSADRPLSLSAAAVRERSAAAFSQLASCGVRCIRPAPTTPERATSDSPPRDLLPNAFRRLATAEQNGEGTADFEYWGTPACFTTRRPYETSIAPPRQVEPVGTDGRTEEAWWQAKLWRYDKSRRSWRLQRATGWSRAYIAGPNAVTGLPVWQDPSRRLFTRTLPRVRVPAGRYAWGAQIYWERSGRSVYGWVEPHVAYGSSPRYPKWCSFGRGAR